MFNLWWLAGLVDGLKPHPPPLSSQKREMLIFGLRSTSDNQPRWSMDSNPIHHPSPAQKNEMLIFGLCSTSDYWNGWSMDSNPICHSSPANKMKCSFLEYVQLLMISLTGQWTRTPSASPLQPIKWNATFWIMFTSDDQPGWSMDSNPICHPSPDKKMKCSFLDYVQLLMIGQAGQWTQTPSTTPLQPKKVKCSFLYYIQHLMLARLVNGLEPHPPPLSSLKFEMLILGLHSTSDD